MPNSNSNITLNLILTLNLKDTHTHTHTGLCDGDLCWVCASSSSPGVFVTEDFLFFCLMTCVAPSLCRKCYGYNRLCHTSAAFHPQWRDLEGKYVLLKFLKTTFLTFMQAASFLPERFISLLLQFSGGGHKSEWGAMIPPLLKGG